MPLGSSQFLLRPSVEGGAGGGVTLASINFEFLYRYDLPSTTWAIYQGTGPAVNFIRFADETNVRGGFNFVFGVRHESGFFSELPRSGARGAPTCDMGSASPSTQENPTRRRHQGSPRAMAGQSGGVSTRGLQVDRELV